VKNIFCCFGIHEYITVIDIKINRIVVSKFPFNSVYDPTTSGGDIYKECIKCKKKLLKKNHGLGILTA
jgi:hypothetical protein